MDNAGLGAINASAYSVKDAIEKNDFKKAWDLWSDTEAIAHKVTNGVNFYNILETAVPTSLTRNKFGSHPLSLYHPDQLSELMNGDIKAMLRIIPANVTWGGQSKLVFESLKEDFMKPVTQIVESILNSTDIRVNVYNGQLDLIVDTMGKKGSKDLTVPIFD